MPGGKDSGGKGGFGGWTPISRQRGKSKAKGGKASVLVMLDMWGSAFRSRMATERIRERIWRRKMAVQEPRGMAGRGEIPMLYFGKKRGMRYASETKQGGTLVSSARRKLILRVLHVTPRESPG